MDTGYPKLIVKGFGGLNGKITGALSVGPYRSRPESVHFFKEGRSLVSIRCIKEAVNPFIFSIYVVVLAKIQEWFTAVLPSSELMLLPL